MRTRILQPHHRVTVAIVAAGMLAVAGCSSSSASKSSSGDTGSTTSRSAAAATSSTTGAGTVSCPTQAQVDAILGSQGQATGAPVCAAGYAAGSATNGQADVAYILVLDGANWTRASDAQTSSICTTNPAKVPRQIVSAGCND